MEILIKTTFIIILSFSLVNLLFNFVSYLSSKQRDQLYLSFFWGTLIVNFMIQAAVQSGENKIIAAFAFSLIPVTFLCMSLYTFLEKSINPLKPIFIGVGSVILTFSLIIFELESFAVKAIPLSFALAIILVSTGASLLKESSGRPLLKVASVVLFLFAIHGFNFAFFRNDPSTQIWGWLTSYALYQILAALLPAIALVEYNRLEKDRLQNIISDRTRALEKANAELGSLLGFKEFLFKTLSHDIATPLMIAVNSTKRIQLEEDHPNSKNQLWISRSQVALEKITDIVQDLRSLESHQPNVSSIMLRECFEKIELEFEYLLKEKNIDLVVHPSVEKAVVEVHRSTFVNSVLSNVVRNAIKFSQESSQIDCYVLSMEDSDKIKLVVKDYGVGIPDSILTQIFSFSEDTSRQGTSGESGTGWGLPIAKTVLESYNGDIKIISKEAKNGNNGQTEVHLILTGSIIDPTNFEYSDDFKTG